VPEEVAVWLRRTPAGWYTINTRRFEQLDADVFRRNYSAAEVTHVGRPDDGGVDVLLVEADGRQWLIQAKRRESPDTSEGISTVRNLLGAMVLEDARYGVVVSTADHFSYRARQAVGRAHERGMVLRLIDKRAFDRLLDPLLPDRPWLSRIAHRASVIC
jgi:HJR/Mrr/RecB family endonuclease